MVADVVLLLIVAFFMVLAARHVISDRRKGVPACGYACGSECNGSCSAINTGRLPNGKKVTKSELRKIRKRIEAREEGKL